MATAAFASTPLNCGLTAEAWAVAALDPARSGSMGYCASAWAITYDCWASIAHRQVIASSYPNRNEWIGGIMAIRGVLENVLPRTKLTIYVPNKALATCYQAGWCNSRGKPHVGADAAKAIFQFRDQLELDLEILHRSLDAIAAPLKAEATAAAKEKSLLLTADERRAVPAGRRAHPLVQLGGFPPVGEGEDEDGSE